MKKFTICVCVAALLCLSVTAAAFERPIPFGFKVENPLLVFPVDEKIIMQNGTLVLEAKDMVYDSTMALVEDEGTSSGYALKCAATSWLEIANLKGPGFMSNILIDKQNSYVIWARIKTPSGSPSYHEKLSNTNAYTTRWILALQEEEQNTWLWRSLVGSVVLKQGMQEIIFACRSNDITYDRFIITSDTSFTPVSKDDVPGMGGDAGDFGAIPANAYPLANVHPRVFVTADEIPALKERVKHEALAPAYERIKAAGTAPLDCTATPLTAVGSNYNAVNCSTLMSRAFLYLLGEVDDNHARETIRQLKIFMETTVYDESIIDITRLMGEELMAAGMVYDWCYDLLTASDKEFIIRQMYDTAGQKEIGWPPTKRNLIWGHGIEGEIFKDNLTAAIAVFDEDPSYYEIVAGTMFGKMIPARQLLMSSLNDPSGSSYGWARYTNFAYANKLMGAIGYDNLFGEKAPQVPYKWIYERLPNGTWFKDGDCWIPERYYIDTWYASYSEGGTFAHTGSAFGDPYLMGAGLLSLYWGGYNTQGIWDILFMDPSEPFSFVDDLPLARHTTYPLSGITARTSWQNGLNSPAALAFMNMREISLGDHQHDDVGSFQIYYKGALALDSGYYEYGAHYDNYQARSVAHNVIMVDDPDEEKYGIWTSLYEALGGQRSYRNIVDYEELISPKAKSAEAKAHYIGPNQTTPEFSYISSELSYAYNDKIEEYERSMVFMDLFRDDYPAAFIVYDNIKTKAPGLKKRWLLHSEQEPLITVGTDRTTTTIRRNEEGYNGKLVNQTLIPAPGKSAFEIIGGPGREFEVDGVNYPILKPKYSGAVHDSGNWRIEVSPTVAAQEDIFLNVMYVTDDDGGHPELPVFREYGTDFLGVTIADRMVTFSKTRDNIKNTIHLTVRNNGYDTVSCMLTDIEEGVWHVVGAGIDTVLESKIGENCLYFKGAPGAYTIEKAVPGSKPQTIKYPEAEKDIFGDFLVRKNNNLMYLPKPTKLVDGRPYIAVDGILTQANVTVESKTSDSITILSGVNTLTLTAESLDYTENGETKQLEYVPKIIWGDLYVDAFDIANRLSSKLTGVAYDPFIKLLKFNVTMPKSIEGVDMEKVIVPVEITGPPTYNDAYPLENMYDNNLSTYYSAQSPTPVLFDLGEEQDIAKISIAFYVGDIRKTFFDVEFSTDGQNFTQVYDGESGGKTSGLEDFRIRGRARYVRFNFKGNTQGGSYNSIHAVLIMK